jgi:hypothetical protein
MRWAWFPINLRNSDAHISIYERNEGQRPVATFDSLFEEIGSKYAIGEEKYCKKRAINGQGGEAPLG